MPDDRTIVPFKPRLIAQSEDKEADALANDVTKATTEDSVDPDIIKMLEFYLERARVGEFVFVAIATVGDDGVAGSTWAPLDRGPQRTTQALGAVTYLGARFTEAALAGDVYEDDDWLDEDGPEKA